LKSFSADYILETICNDLSIIETNLRLKIQESPDYADQ
jgi:6-phosphofructo-2-kinase/fructose-2,6-biphosphatase